MKKATFITLVLACCIGATLISWGGWWLMFVGLAVAVCLLAYSAGPFPLSHNGLGEVAVIIFFGFIPVIFTQYVQTRILYLDSGTLLVGLAIGLMSANVLIVNNYRDLEEDKAVGKKTLAVIIGRQATSTLYFINGMLAAIFLAMASSPLPFWVSAGWLAYFAFHSMLWSRLRTLSGKALNDVLKYTSFILFIVACYLLVVFASLKPYYGFINLP